MIRKRTLSFKKIVSKLPVLSYDAFSIPLAWYLAFFLLTNFKVSPLFPENPLSLLLLIGLQIGCYFYFKIYRGLWRFFSLKDLTRIIQAVGCASVGIVPLLLYFSLIHKQPYSIFPLYGLILCVLLCGGRMLVRAHWDKRNRHKHVQDSKRVLIIGAGQAGEGLIRDLKRTSSYLPIGVLDDNANKRDLELHGVQVIGSIPDVRYLVVNYQIDLIFIAIPSARSVQMRRIVKYCEECNIPFRTLPSIQAYAAGRVEVDALRDVRIEDLLGRDQVQLNWDKISENIHQKRILVTGGGGSIGSELCLQIMANKPSALFILDNSEYNLYKIDLELKKHFPETKFEVALANVADKTAINQIFTRFKPQVIFHAAAYKHVPLLEDQIRVAVQNNVIGTQIVAEASVVSNAEKFILISTDKAVNPTNIMGTTKRVAEIYCQNLNSHVSTQFITVRFGNVLGSVGSVIPLFQAQLQQGGPLTVTHPDIQRYFMTIGEACQLILQAMANGQGGEIFVLDMGEPIKISYLAEQMIRLAGKEPGTDIALQYTGLRPGEKLFEEIFHPSEELVSTEHEKLFKAKFRQINWDELTQTMRMLRSACDTYQDDELFVLLKSLVPEFSSSIDDLIAVS